MANNRMVLVCNVCKPTEWDYVDRKGVLPIAKWYPGGGGEYYRNDFSTLGEEFKEFLIEHAHPELPSDHYTAGAGQPNPIRLEYESTDKPLLPHLTPPKEII
jgi:hypothetical protein